MIRRMAFVSALASIAVASPAPARAAKATEAHFNIGAVALSVPLPEGFCVPEGDMAVAASRLAAADPANVTHLTLVTCGGRTFGQDYFVFKTPVNMIGVTVTRESLFESLRPYFGAAGSEPFPDVARMAGETLSDRLGQRVDLTGSVKALGMDADCAYLGGIMTVSTAQIEYTGVVGSCVTAVGGAALMVTSVGRGNATDDVARHLRSARSLAVQVVAAKH